jgi:hypothetical protein
MGYVPIWYQERFMRPRQHRYFRLDLKPDVVTNGAHNYTRNSLHWWAPNRNYAEDDLYTTRWGDISNIENEKFFFRRGPSCSLGNSLVCSHTNFVILPHFMRPK